MGNSLVGQHREVGRNTSGLTSEFAREVQISQSLYVPTSQRTVGLICPDCKEMLLLTFARY